MIADLVASPGAVIMVVGALVGIASSLLGAFLVLRRSSMLADAISHSVLLGIVVVFLLTRDHHSPWFILGAAAVGVLTVAMTELLASSKRVKIDAAIGLVFTFLFALAILLINLLARNVHIDTHAVLLGEIAFVWLDTTPLGGLEVPKALLTISAVTLINALFVTLFYKELKLATFDPGLAAALGFSPTLIFYLLLSLTSITAVTAFEAVGAILLIAFIIVPPAAGYLLTDRLWLMLLWGGLISIASSILGYLAAVALDASISGMMATIAGGFLVLAFLAGPRYGLLAQELRRRRSRFDNAERMLLVHLYQHEGQPGSQEERRVAALASHLRWRPREINRLLQHSLDHNLLTRGPGDTLLLTPKGRVLAQEVLEPWRG